MSLFFLMRFATVIGFWSAIGGSLASLPEAVFDTPKEAPCRRCICEIINKDERQLSVELVLKNGANHKVEYKIKLPPAHVNDRKERVPSQKVYWFNECEKFLYRIDAQKWRASHTIEKEDQLFVHTILCDSSAHETNEISKNEEPELFEIGITDLVEMLEFVRGAQMPFTIPLEWPKRARHPRTQAFPLYGGYYKGGADSLKALYNTYGAFPYLLITRNDDGCVLGQCPQEIRTTIFWKLLERILVVDKNPFLMTFDDLIKDNCLTR